MTQDGRVDIYLNGKFQASAAMDLEWYGQGEDPKGETVKEVFGEIKWVNKKDFMINEEDFRDGSRWLVLPGTFAPPAI